MDEHVLSTRCFMLAHWPSVCSDDNECVDLELTGCENGTYCENTPGSFNCAGKLSAEFFSLPLAFPLCFF